jgi:formyl-CoA transferase
MALERADFITDSRFESPAARLENTDVLVAELERAFVEWPLAKLLPRMEAADQVVSPVLDYTGLTQDEQVIENRYIMDVPSEQYGPVRMVGFPVQLSETPASVRSLPAEMGTHTAEILAEIGFGDDDIAALITSGVAGAATSG